MLYWGLGFAVAAGSEHTEDSTPLPLLWLSSVSACPTQKYTIIHISIHHPSQSGSNGLSERLTSV